ncbi:hypothetical protein BU14_0060s0020 [Porphyra umbilicalis]|uniref:Uncharacterized protein n=1 Tax=Porphyra umbilicalis TaxID=2786 RepID=A0A1X6PH08_PORUM|nr:hypothetical protein BU14_0060s0020 [Porphyra umbilicalis]|eukprot:OSX80055.1 hypothetical protein BU14_0060s0020 [Porphyra umbilicalis]
MHAKDNLGSTALHSAGGSERAEAVNALLAAGADVHAKRNDGLTALHMAGREGGAATVEALAAGSADLKATDQDGWTALHFAVSRGHTPVVAALLQLGAAPTPVCSAGETPLCIAVALGHREIIDLLPPTHPANAVSTPALEAVKRKRVALLDNDRVRPFLHDTDRASRDRVLHVAARRADATTVVALLHRRADVRSANIQDETPLASALSWYAKKLSAARDLAGVMAGRPDLHLRAVAEGLRPPPPRTDGLTPGAVSAAMHEQIDGWRRVVIVLLHAGAVTKGLGHDGAALCARVVASFPSLGPRRAVRLLCTRRLKVKSEARRAAAIEELG